MTTPRMRTDSDELAYENGRNSTYIERMRGRPIVSSVGAPANTLWTGSVSPSHFRPGVLTLFGRIGLGGAEVHMGDNFYIGSGHFEEGDLRVFSWVAPVARVFFQQVDDWLDVPVVVRRTFRLGAKERILELYDDWVGRSQATSPFDRRARLTLPTPPPGARQVPSARAAWTPPILSPAQTTPSPAAEPRIPPVVGLPTSAPSGPEGRPTVTGLRRAANAVKAALAAPRAERMNSVLSTLQPDQYALVIYRRDRPLVIQGHPGTGKTIVAVHRAAYLANPDRGEGEPSLRVLVLGPTKDWVTHVRTAIDDLIPPGAVTVTNLQRCMFQLAGLDEMPPGSLDGTATDVDWAVGDVIDDLADRMRGARRNDDDDDVQAGVALLWAALRTPGGLIRTRRLPGRVRAWMEQLPPYEAAARQARYLPAIAYCSLALYGAGGLDRFDHLVVDEAQDVRPLEWRIISRLNRGGGWTLVGDTNQRRADFCDTNWRSVTTRLGLTVDGRPVVPEVMTLGYRSTQQIMAFANRLLPVGSQRMTSIQVGPQPTIVRARPSELFHAVVVEAHALARRHPDGLTAVITVEPGAVKTYLRSKGWRVGDNPNNLSSGGSTIHVRRPDHARGVEYDGVVVVEPEAFPRNAGDRAGALYTSLTRANRELVVVYSRKLTKELVGSGASIRVTEGAARRGPDKHDGLVERY